MNEESNFIDEYKKAGWELCLKILDIKEDEATSIDNEESKEIEKEVEEALDLMFGER